MQAGVDLGMPFLGLRNAEQRVDLRQQRRQGARGIVYGIAAAAVAGMLIAQVVPQEG